MASIKLQHRCTSKPYSHTSFLAFLLLSSLQTPTYAQQTVDPTLNNPFATAANGVGPPTGWPDSSDNGSGVNVSRYYFIILGVVILIFLISGWFLIRKRVYQNAQTRAGGGPTARGTGGDPDARRWTTGRWRLTPARVEEGLNERGEAPPPYIPGQSSPPAVPVGIIRHPVTGEPIPLEDLSGKPPDYDGRSSSEEDLNLTRPRPTYAVPDRSEPRRHLLGGTESSEESTGTGLPGASEDTQMRRIDEMGHDSTTGAHETPEMNRNEGHTEMPGAKTEATHHSPETIPSKPEGPSEESSTIPPKPAEASPPGPM